MKSGLGRMNVGFAILMVGATGPGWAQEETEGVQHRGSLEFRVSGGVNFGSGREETTSTSGNLPLPAGALTPKVPPTVSAGIAFGLSRHLAVLGEYATDSLGTYYDTTCRWQEPVSPGTYRKCFGGAVPARIREWMGGLRISTASRGRADPYLVVAAGDVQSSSSAGAEGVPARRFDGVGISDNSASTSRFGVGAGAGVDFRIMGRIGGVIDFRAVKGMDIRWFFRPTAGIRIRFL